MGAGTLNLGDSVFPYTGPNSSIVEGPYTKFDHHRFAKVALILRVFKDFLYR